MRIDSLKDFVKVVRDWKRNDGDGRPTLAELALVYVWNYVPDEVMVDAIAYYKYENVSSELYPTDTFCPPVVSFCDSNPIATL